MQTKYISYKDINNFLRQTKKIKFTDRLIELIKFRTGTPYKKSPFKKEGYDRVPFFPLRYSDCTSFVLTSTALAVSKNINDAKQKIIKLHYKNNTVNFENRFHFTGERITKSKYFKNISNKISKNYNISRVTLNKKYNGLKLINIDFERKVSLHYIPLKEFINCYQNINNKIVNIAFGRQSNIRNGHFISHEGFLLDKKSLIHSSLDKGRVVKVNIIDYLKRTKFDGIIIVKLDLTNFEMI